MACYHTNDHLIRIMGLHSFRTWRIQLDIFYLSIITISFWRWGSWGGEEGDVEGKKNIAFLPGDIIRYSIISHWIQYLMLCLLGVSSQRQMFLLKPSTFLSEQFNDKVKWKMPKIVDFLPLKFVSICQFPAHKNNYMTPASAVVIKTKCSVHSNSSSLKNTRGCQTIHTSDDI